MSQMDKQVTIFWYSQTGHSFTCARTAEALLKKNDFTVNFESIYNWDSKWLDTGLFIFVFPVFNFNVPVALKKILRDIPRLKNRGEALAIITCAGVPANTPKILKDFLEKKNIHLASHLIIRSRDSYIPFAKWFSIINAKRKPDSRSFSKVEKYVYLNLVKGINEKSIWFNPLNPFHWLGAVAPDNGAKLLLGERIFKKELCVKCGFCAALCPSGSIKVEDGKICYEDKTCIGCCGCMNICPENAWETSWFDAKYYNKGLNVKNMANASGKRAQTRF